MAKFTFNLPDGQLFTLDGPPGATIAQAELIFLEQLASGSFVGLRPGDILQSPATTIRQFELSRLDRGTAGVQDIPLIAIYNGGAIATTTTTTAVTVLSSLPSLADVPVVNGITAADYLAQTTVIDSVGPLNPSQVQAVLAAIAAFVCQEPDAITNESGLGRYGLSAPQLEQTGYLKPSTACRFITDPAEFVNVLSSESVWTGRGGVTSVDNILNNPALQDRIQLALMQSSYDTLVQSGQIVVADNTGYGSTGQSGRVTFDAQLLAALGLAAGAVAGIQGLQTTATNLINSGIAGVDAAVDTVTGAINTVTGAIDSTITSISNLPGTLNNLVNTGIADVGGLLANASKFGVDNAVAWAKGLLPGGLLGKMQQLAKLGQFAVNFNDFKLPSAVKGIAPAIGYAGTVNRDTVNAATAKLIGSDKIPLPKFAPVTAASGALTALAKQAKGILAGGIAGITTQLGNVASTVRSAVATGASVVASARSVISSIRSFF